ncbi:MAG: ABC transporter ATP-binding protein [Ruminococcus sp.]|nr:ABC transporter ATP-binding protein [Ruminococcus sp.]
MSILAVNNLTKIYTVGGDTTAALDHVSFSVEEGSFVAIVGTSGSGKSTLLHLIGGVDRPTEGSVFVDGKDIFEMNESGLSEYRRRTVSVIYQFYNLLPMLNVKANITLPLELDGKLPDGKRLDEILRFLGLEEKRFHYPDQLSGGQQQRVAIARSLMTSPKLLLADEPTGNLDSRNSAEIISLLKKSNRKLKQTILLVTHDMSIAEQADRIICISDGKIAEDRIPAEK